MEMRLTMKLFALTPAAGKRLIGKAIVRHPAIQAALSSGTLAVIAGTTNGYVAEEILASLGQGRDFSRRRFFRGITTPPRNPVTAAGRLPDESKFPGDVILRNGEWQKGKTIFDVVDELHSGDVILKGANALDLIRGQAAVLVGDSKTGPIGVVLQAAVGRRVGLIIPVGLEKRVSVELAAAAAKINAPGGQGLRLMPIPGEVFTELQALALLTGARAELAAAGGVGGAEGGVWLAVEGTAEQLQAADALISSVAAERAFEL
jgi:hypothetical protein